MIRSWANSATRRLFESGKSRFRDTETALELLAILNAAERLNRTKAMCEPAALASVLRRSDELADLEAVAQS